MRMPAAHRDRSSNMNGPMTPMIDVVFLLLVFFVWTASFQIIEQVLPSSLTVRRGGDPTSVDEPPPPEEDFDDVVVRIRREGNRTVWQINDAPVDSLQTVRERLRVIAEINAAAPVILHPDSAVPLGDVIDVYDLARLAGFEKVRFAASQRI